MATSILAIDKDVMARLLHDEPTFSDRFISHMLTRNMRIEADLVDQLFNSSEKRLARTLLLMARYGQAGPERTLPKISQETLAEMIGTTRSRVNFFMNKFRKLGLIEYNGTIKINPRCSASSCTTDLPARGLCRRVQTPSRVGSTLKSAEKEPVMLGTLILVLVVLWLLGMVTSYTMGGLIHILLVIAVIVVLLRVIQGRNPLKG